MVRSGILPPPAGDHRAASDDGPLSVVRGHAVLRYWSAPTVVPSEPSTGPRGAVVHGGVDRVAAGAPGSGLGGSCGRAGLQDRDLRRRVVVRAGELAAGLLPLGEEATLGVEDGEVRVAGRADLGPADRQAERDRTGLEPDVAGAADPLDVVDRLDLGRLGEERREPGAPSRARWSVARASRRRVVAIGGIRRPAASSPSRSASRSRPASSTRTIVAGRWKRWTRASSSVSQRAHAPGRSRPVAASRAAPAARGLGPIGCAGARCRLGNPCRRSVVGPARAGGRGSREGGGRVGRRAIAAG